MSTAKAPAIPAALFATRVADQAPGQRLQDVLSNALASKGEVVNFRLTPSAGYAAVRMASGRVEAYVVPYQVDFGAPAPRSVRYGVLSERDNPLMAAAPNGFVDQLSPALDEGSAAWRRRCWASQIGREKSLSVFSPGDVVMLSREVKSNHGPLRPDFYTVRAHDHGFTVLAALTTGRSALVQNVTADAVKIPLEPDPLTRLASYPGVVRFGVHRVALGDEQSQCHLLIGRTASGAIVPLAQANGKEERDFMLERVWEISKLRQEALRGLDRSPLFAYMVDRDLADAAVDQVMGREPKQIADLQITVEPPEQALDNDYDYQSPSL